MSLDGLPYELVAEIDGLEHHCPDFHVISAYRPHARVAGSGRISLHALHKAADVSGPDYACAYAYLARFAGGVSTDARRVHHIHLSWDPGGREWHARFRHWQPSHRYAAHTRRIHEHRVAILVRRRHRN